MTKHGIFYYLPPPIFTIFEIFTLLVVFLNSLIRNCSTESQHQNQIKIQKASDHGENFETSFILVRCEIQFHAILEL